MCRRRRPTMSFVGGGKITRRFFFGGDDSRQILRCRDSSMICDDDVFGPILLFGLVYVNLCRSRRCCCGLRCFCLKRLYLLPRPEVREKGGSSSPNFFRQTDRHKTTCDDSRLYPFANLSFTMMKSAVVAGDKDKPSTFL